MLLVRRDLLVLVLVLAAFLMTACTGQGEALTPETDRSGKKESSQEINFDKLNISIKGIEVRMGKSIKFFGEADLPDGECLFSELSSNGSSLDWWPMDQCLYVINGVWEIELGLRAEGRQDNLDPNETYRLKVWWSEAPEDISEVFYFDLSSPPSPKSED